MDLYYLPSATGQICGPLVHELPTPLEQVASEVGSLNPANGVSKGGFGDFSRLARFSAPVAK